MTKSKTDKRIMYRCHNFYGTLRQIAYIFGCDYEDLHDLVYKHNLQVEDAVAVAMPKQPPVTQEMLEGNVPAREFKLTDDQRQLAEEKKNIVSEYIERNKITDEDEIQELYLEFLYTISKVTGKEKRLKAKIQLCLNNFHLRYQRMKYINSQLFIEDRAYSALQHKTNDGGINQVDISEMITAIKNCMKVLNEREAKVISMRYGFSTDPMTLLEISELLGVTRERVRQIEAKALRKIQNRTTCRPLKYYIQ